MAKLNTYKVRSGNAIPIIPDGGGNSSQGSIIFTFGTERQEIISCGSEEEVASSRDMCLLGGEYFSANYSALPAKVNGKIKFASNLAKAPKLSSSYETGCTTGSGPVSSPISGDTPEQGQGNTPVTGT